jgi:flagellar basal body-associated protein FliL
MSNDNNIKNFSAADIERYHKGQLSSKEMNALEKAALDDPFLADAIEGYAFTTDINEDITELEQRLAQKTGETKVVPMYASGKSSSPWLRVAVLFILIAGASLLSYQFLFNNNSTKDLASKENKVPQPEKAKDTSNTNSDLTSGNNNSIAQTPVENNVSDKDTKQTDKIINRKPIVANGLNEILSNTHDSLKADYRAEITPGDVAERKVEKDAVRKDESNIVAEHKIEKADSIVLAFKKPALSQQQNNSRDKEKTVTANSTSDDFYLGFSKDQYKLTEKRAASPSRKEGALNNTEPNVFRGVVTDANNNALPFANIINTRDNVGTYSDARGYFTLMSPVDSVMNVQVKVVGFESNNVQLRNRAGDNQITMREDTKSLTTRYLDTVKRDYANRSREATMTFEEPEPEDGWAYFGSYLVNNLNVPESYEMKKGGESSQNVVEVSFEISKSGDPIKIKVEKSLCDKCDKEAIRLIQNGPKWKSKAKKGKRTTVKVPFIKTE